VSIILPVTPLCSSPTRTHPPHPICMEFPPSPHGGPSSSPRHERARPPWWWWRCGACSRLREWLMGRARARPVDGVSAHFPPTTTSVPSAENCPGALSRQRAPQASLPDDWSKPAAERLPAGWATQASEGISKWFLQRFVVACCAHDSQPIPLGPPSRHSVPMDCCRASGFKLQLLRVKI
jgi:hypothetical protein